MTSEAKTLTWQPTSEHNSHSVCRVIVIVRQQFTDTGPRGSALPRDSFHIQSEPQPGSGQVE